MEKEGKANIKFFVSAVFLLLLMVFLAFGLGIKIATPNNMSINNNTGVLTTSRNINFTFNVTWSADSEEVGNCSLWTNFSGKFEKMLEFNGTGESEHNYTANITNASISYVNYTFSHDLGYFVWDIGCRNYSGAIVWTFNTSNRSLAIDTALPEIIQTQEFFDGFNTSSATPSMKFNITDVNGTGINLTTGGEESNNVSLNITIYHFNGVDAENDAIPGKNFTLFNSSVLSCDVTSAGAQSVQCTLSNTAGGVPLNNGTKNITIKVSDMAGWVSNISFKFTVDQISPKVDYYNFTNTSMFNTTAGDTGNALGGVLNGSVFRSIAPGGSPDTIYATANWTDNLTMVSTGFLQFFNTTKAGLGEEPWQTLNITGTNVSSHLVSWTNFSFPVPQGRTEFEGMNVSFRIIANDTVGNVNDSMSVVNFTILINDTYAPTILINGSGGAFVNGSNITDTTPTIGFIVDENNPLNFINISIDANQTLNNAPGKDTVCEKAAFFDTSSDIATVNVEKNRNNSITVKSDTGCPLINGPHNVTVTAEDSWGNLRIYHYVFSIESGTQPGLQFNLTSAEGKITNISKVTNSTYGINITSSMGIRLFGYNGVTASIDKIAYVSSCNSTSTVVVTNGTIVYPFNESSCNVQSENRTLTVTINDTAGNSNTTVLGFLVDNVAPSFTEVISPTNGEIFDNANLSINFTVRDDDQGIAFYGYYLDSVDDILFIINISSDGTIAPPGVSTTAGIFVDNHTGTHTIKFTVNDTLGNTENSSWYTFTQKTPVNLLDANSTITANNGNITNVSFFNTTGSWILNSSSIDIDQTFELFIGINATIGNTSNTSVTINFDGSAANWNKTDKIFVKLNNSKRTVGIEKNHTATVVYLVSFNGSMNEFLPSNSSYYGKVTFGGINATNYTLNGLDLWYFENDLNAKTNVTICPAGISLGHSSSSSLPCWNNTNNRSVDVFVPHFSDVALVNNSDPPTLISVNYPLNGSQTESTFLPNITVSDDAVLCNYTYVGANQTATPNATMTGPITFGNNKLCYGPSEISVINGTDQNNNITFRIWDANGNNLTIIYNFNVSDLTPPNITSVTNGTTGTTSWQITVTANESVNATVYYGTANTTLTTNVSETDFSKTQTVTLSSLSESTGYWFNVTACDKAGNCMNNGTYYFLTSAGETTTTSTTTSSSSGGGGGGGGAVPSSNVADSKAQVWSTIPAGSSFSLDVDKETIAVTAVAVSNVQSELSNVELEVAALTENPVSTDASAKVYQYLRITKKNLANEDAGFKVRFRVTKAWLTENGLTSVNIALYRFDNGWNELSTSVVNTDSTYVYYEAETPGFSSFAVGVKGGVAVEEEVPAEEVPTEEAEEEAEAPEEVEKPIPIEAPSKSPMGWIIVAIVVILGIVLIIVYQKKKKGA
ncbi:PGF-pre-PGF domain-containing protein [Candidatus Woesearchaeota archaeon]|nr:PGF-pre-PGF domain-containing protein [Candidatus Woesearchaeota archaeon]